MAGTAVMNYWVTCLCWLIRVSPNFRKNWVWHRWELVTKKCKNSPRYLRNETIILQMSDAWMSAYSLIDEWYQRSATSSRSSSACAKRTVNWRCTEPGCCHPSPNCRTPCLRMPVTRSNPSTPTSLVVSSVSSPPSRTLTSTPSPLKRPKSEWGLP